MSKLLTIVIPTYNMEAYLNRCLDSLLISDEQMQLLEVLVINDGSKDKSSAIAHEYEAKYPNTFRVIDKENGNYGSCVNRGLKEASGKYIKVLDADDWFDTTEFEKYLTQLQSVDVDMVLTPFMSVNENTGEKQLCTQPYLQENRVYLFNECNNQMILRYSMHMVTYRVELLRRIQYVQTEGISYTDTEWTHLPQYSISNLVWIQNVVYQYYIGREGQTMDATVLAKNIWKYEVICKSLIENSSKYPDKEICQFAEELNLQQIEFLAVNIYRMFLVLVSPSKDDINHLKQFDAYLKHACPKVYKSVGKAPLKKWLSLPYIKIWRCIGVRIPIDFLRDTYRKFKYGAKKA